jgi:hypothetical protein
MARYLAGAISETIRIAFREVAHPGPLNLVSGPDWDPEFRELRLALAERDWESLSVADVYRLCDALPFMTPEAVHHFIPAYMIHCTLAPYDVNAAKIGVARALRPRGKTPQALASWQRLHAMFDGRQRLAVRAYLTYEDAWEREDWERSGAHFETTEAGQSLAWWNVH